ncbi:RadC family protein [Pseudomonas mosselii]|uniref:DNA repair protein RadC n=1 Tax=Pseudomonas mosselii TaxID=78327 RepID=A0A7W2JZQ1_9PSED|nr:DNA repair protein RadC [Pseudomonas mosselii]MBA6068086.1 DNA repair protein RadC [Pseudomonas mosselii]
MQQFERDVIQQALSILDSHLKTKGAALQSPEAVRDFLRLQLEQEESEVFAVLYLDSQHRLLAFKRMFNGTIDSAAVYPREVVKAGLALNASAAIICHNHPSGDATPSNADRQLTVRLKDALALVDIRLVDHMVVGHKQIVSFAEQGWI